MDCLASESDCQVCPVGYFQVYPDKCTYCPSAIKAGETDCAGCKPGFLTLADGSCNACPAGYLSTTVNASVCPECPHGFWTKAKEAAIECLHCPQGRWSSERAIVRNFSSCIACQRGRWSDICILALSALLLNPAAVISRRRLPRPRQNWSWTNNPTLCIWYRYPCQPAPAQRTVVRGTAISAAASCPARDRQHWVRLMSSL